MDEATDSVDEPTQRLTRRELEVLAMAARGLTNQQVGGHLNVSLHAVKFHLASIYRKLGVANRTEAAGVYWQRQHEAQSRATSD
jgi:ATP/maltotriose-dependent transcriptional regulator MalT